MPPMQKNKEDEEFDIMKDYMQVMGRKIGGIGEIESEKEKEH